MTSAEHAARVARRQLRSQEESEDGDVCPAEVKTDLGVTIAFLVLLVTTKTVKLATLTNSTTALGRWLLLLTAMLIGRRALYKLREWRERSSAFARVAPLGRLDATPLRPLGRVDEPVGLGPEVA